MTDPAAHQTIRHDPVTLEVLRNRLESIGEEAGATLERTAISPVVVESKDYSVTLLDADGRLVVGTGQVQFHYGAAAHAVRHTLARHAATLAPGDVFIANDPHSGGGLHPQDVVVQRPIFGGDGGAGSPRLVGWVVISAHMMDMGGMVPGSFAPNATECFQEAFRMPAVRLFRAGVEQEDVWELLRCNVRLAELVELDLRSLVAGAHVAATQVGDLAVEVGSDRFAAELGAIRDLTEEAFRSRLRLIEDGRYHATAWTEWDEDAYVLPCTLTVDDGELTFDFTGTSPQAPHYFNSKPYIIETELVSLISSLLARDLPYNDGIYAPIHLVCPEGSLVNSRPPAPIGAAHIDVALNAAETAMQCLRMALAASPDAPGRRYLTGWSSQSALGLNTWSATGLDGKADAWLMLDGSWSGSTAGAERDGLPLSVRRVGAESGHMFPDIEVLESWYPILIHHKGPRRGAAGAGVFRAAGGNVMAFSPHGTDRLVGAMLGMRRWFPLDGNAGGRPGATTEFVIRRDGVDTDVAAHAVGVVVEAGETFEFRCGSGGGWGDPLDRDPGLVAVDVDDGIITPEEAGSVYGVVLGDEAATIAGRAAQRTERLTAALPAPVPPPDEHDDVVERARSRAGVPLAPGVLQRGPVAFSEQSGAPLAVAPGQWADGCPRLEAPLRGAGSGPPLVVRAYLDPATGRALHVETVPAGTPRSFAVEVRRWMEAATA
jgi:N-methylhydantoinase B